MTFGIYAKDTCKSCLQERYIQNKSKVLCKNCNTISKLKDKKVRSYIKRINKESGKDQQFFREMFGTPPRQCEECGTELRIFSASYVSHIIARGANTALRHEPENVRIYCFACHQIWEFQDRTKMKTYQENEEIRQKLTLKYYTEK